MRGEGVFLGNFQLKNCEVERLYKYFVLLLLVWEKKRENSVKEWFNFWFVQIDLNLEQKQDNKAAI